MFPVSFIIYYLRSLEKRAWSLRHYSKRRT